MPDAELLRCPACGATNRIPREPLLPGRKAICGRCKAPLTAAVGPVIVTDATFVSEVEQSPLPVLLDLWAPWCGPCRAVAPIIEQLSVEWAGRVRVAKMNVDDNPETAGRFGVQSIPTLLVFKAGREVDRIVGAQPKSEVVRRVEGATA